MKWNDVLNGQSEKHKHFKLLSVECDCMQRLHLKTLNLEQHNHQLFMERLGESEEQMSLFRLIDPILHRSVAAGQHTCSLCKKPTAIAVLEIN